MSSIERYLTSNNITTAIAVIAFIFSLITAIEVIREKDEWGRIKIKPVGWTLIILSILLIVLTITLRIVGKKEINQNIVTQKKSTDSTHNADRRYFTHEIDSLLKPHKLTYNDTTHTIVNTVVKNQPDPVLTLIPDSVMFIGKLPDSLRVNIDFVCINNSIAYNVKCKMLIFLIRNKLIKVIYQSDKIKYRNLISTNIQTIFMHSQLMTIKTNHIQKDSLYFFFKADYSNKFVNGKTMPPTRGIYYTLERTLPKSPSDLKILPVEMQQQFETIRNKLVKNKYW